jgi:hypothetical protein
MLTVYLDEKINRKFGYKDETLWKEYEKGN